MRILLVTQFYWPEARTAPANLAALAEDLAASGHDVTVLTGVPNHPLGTVYAGYRMRAWQREERRGVTIVRVPLYPDHSRSIAGRLANYLSFTVAATTIGAWQTRHVEPDVLVAYLAPLTMAWTVAALNLLRRVPVVYWVTDMWPENVRATGVSLPARAFAWLERVERWAYRRASAICIDSPGFRDILLNKGVPARAIHVVHEWADERLFHPTEREPDVGARLGLTGRFNVMYAGNLGAVQGLETVVDAAASMQDLDDVQFVLVGDGTERERLQTRVRQLGLENVRFVERQPLERVRFVLAWGDLLLVHLRRSAMVEAQLPSKVLAYLACARPILCAVPGTVEAIVRDAGAGLCCPPEDPAAMARQIRRARDLAGGELEAMGRRGHAAYLERFTRARQVAELQRILLEVSSTPA